ncbi:unnamed protein product [Rhodiola kirilowii]
MDGKAETKSDLKTPSQMSTEDAMGSDLSLPLATQEQENTENPPLESDDGDDDEYSSSVFSYDDEDYEFFENHEGPIQLRFMEEEEAESGLETDLDMEEDDIDPDEMSYEELLALGEIVGEANRGLTGDQISSCLEECDWYSSESKTVTDRCVVCQTEYEEGEKLVGLIACAHPYHEDCISQWLQVKKTCPICNTQVSPAVGTS